MTLPVRPESSLNLFEDTVLRLLGLGRADVQLLAAKTCLSHRPQNGRVVPSHRPRGVSGTGKSELPRLYAHFGGMEFFPLPVQPNWDSQEAMLGFLNSIDNKFDTQPVLRFLVCSQNGQKENGQAYPGLYDAVCLILLDEINPAHPELFFAEFLSKLELRRDCKNEKMPSLAVKLGAGLEPYRLPLGRNVLWAGSMNLDETTKSLSDKVLDRSIVIHFPRPTSLVRREKLEPLPPAAPLLPRTVWQNWWARESDFTDDEVRPFKDFIEEMNKALTQVGRALGHRVWQSIEYSMANYPSVRTCRKARDNQGVAEAMRTAFEDQLVQKVMPKLRGIETRGQRPEDCLRQDSSAARKKSPAVSGIFSWTPWD